MVLTQANTPVYMGVYRGRGQKSVIDYFLVRKECMRRVKDVKVHGEGCSSRE